MRRVAVVTGGASGIGAACARRLAVEGCAVVIADRDESAAARVAGECGGDAVLLDVADRAGVAGVFEEVLRLYGRLDVAINSAGVGVPERRSIDGLDFETWRRVLSINLDGVFLCMSAEVSAMLDSGGGSIVNIASVMSVVGAAGAAPYVAAKHGIMGLTKAAALEFADRGIRVNAVGPGHVETPMFSKWSPAEQAEITSQYPMGRIARADEVASFVCMIAGDSARFATGAYFPLDGGYTAQ
ncbi:SDR family oxidoreductase [Leucobacter weissii]|uniref:SDR family oxidoreductase n=1 Tax=Leucobacter weissii TaxID=1983706 RepID=A0A939SBG5_9MICO|nr:SDR family oxidoreductase [Leucobacter weissii]MBO1901420.1 SDR family oxidoreductase [Leucobacter weissii]